MDARDQGALVSLPAEILIKILLLLPTPGALLAATRTCRALQDLFRSHAVQYSFQLMTSHMQDWTVLDSKIAPAPVAERHAILDERQRRWRTLEWKRRQAVVAKHGDGGTVYDFLGGVLALGMDSPCRTLRFYKIPSTLGSTDVPSRACTPGFTIKDFSSDPAQDLLVLIQTMSTGTIGARRHSFRIHLLTLSSFEPHPEAKEPTLDWPYTLSRMTSPFISVADEVCSLQASNDRSALPEGGLCIWNWKRGVRVATQASTLDEVIESFTFLAKDVYLTATVNDEIPNMFLNLHTFDSGFVPSTDAPDYVPPPILLSMHALPDAEARPALMTLRLDPAPGTHPGLPPFAEGEGRTPMFVPDSKERLVVLDLTFVVQDQEHGWAHPVERRYTLFILKSTLMKTLKHFPPLEELHKQAALDRLNAQAEAPPAENAASGTSTPTLHDLVLGPRAQAAGLFDRVLANALSGSGGSAEVPVLTAEGDAQEEEVVLEDGEDNESDWADEASVEGNSGIRPLHRDWIEWCDHCRLISGIPFEHSWVLYVYQSKFVHAVCQQAEDDTHGRHIGVRARVLDFSPYAVARQRALGAEARTPSAAFLRFGEELPPLSDDKGDRGRLVAKPNVVRSDGVWVHTTTTGKELPYVERETEPLAFKAIPGQTEHLSGLCIDEQRIVFVKRNAEGDVVFDVLFF